MIYFFPSTFCTHNSYICFFVHSFKTFWRLSFLALQLGGFLPQKVKRELFLSWGYHLIFLGHCLYIYNRMELAYFPDRTFCEVGCDDIDPSVDLPLVFFLFHFTQLHVFAMTWISKYNSFYKGRLNLYLIFFFSSLVVNPTRILSCRHLMMINNLPLYKYIKY